ncbi:hypothetical protein ACNI3K_09375 [Demequina sp. SO4-13]|uniref:hypothetical protein n=1 Tax=Demequina sp. SO4-13 TaxID=3401027 RepID=UPI003AF6D95E
MPMHDALTTVVAVLLVAMTLILTPMAPGGLVDTRVFAPLPRWQFNLFNAFLVSLGLASLIIAGFSVGGATWVYTPAIVVGALFIAVYAADLAEIFPVVPDRMPSHLLVLEVINLALAGTLVVLSIKGLLT